nr:MAG TPA: hypothetical protein [Caudoviricetes sp.]
MRRDGLRTSVNPSAISPLCGRKHPAAPCLARYKHATKAWWLQRRRAAMRDY